MTVPGLTRPPLIKCLTLQPARSRAGVGHRHDEDGADRTLRHDEARPADRSGGDHRGERRERDRPVSAAGRGAEHVNQAYLATCAVARAFSVPHLWELPRMPQ